MRRLEVVFLILAASIILVISTGNVVGVSNNEGYTKDGNSVYWEVDDIGRLEVYPHTTYGSRHCYQLNITSYLPSQNLDFAFEFDRGITNKDIFLWKNYTHEITVYEYSNATNGTEEITGSHLEQQTFYDWFSIKDRFSSIVRNNHDWHFITDIYWDQNLKRKLKFCFDSPASMKNTQAKWQLFAKRSSDTLEDAIADKKYIKLDPWYAYGLNTGLVSYWSFDIDERDDVGVNNGTVINSYHNTTDYMLGGGSWYFPPGDGTYINIGQDSSLDLDAMSASVWVKTTNNGTNVILGSYTGTQDYFLWFVRKENIAYGRDSNVLWSGQSPTTYPCGPWYHLAFTVGGGADLPTLYIDGVEQDNDWPTANNVVHRLIQGDVFIGHRASLSTGDFDGVMDELAIWDRVLSEEEIGYLYNNGNGLAYPFEYAPIMQTARTYSVSNTTADNLAGYCNATDADGDNVSYYWKWYKNNALYDSGWNEINYSQGLEVNVVNISAANITVGNWTFSCLAYDNLLNSSWLNSSPALEIILHTADENEGRNAIESGIQDSLTSGYTIYTDQWIYVRLANGSQKMDRFDTVAVYGSQRWAFNYLTGTDAYANLFNVTPIFYVWEDQSLYIPQIKSQVSAFINGTKS